jgi:hypothetical protein
MTPIDKEKAALPKPTKIRLVDACPRNLEKFQSPRSMSGR